MKKILFISLVLAFGLSHAQQNLFSGSYIGLGLGQSTLDFADLSVTEIEDDKNTAWKIFYGWSLHKNFALEFEYNKLGEFSLDDSSLNAEADLEPQSVGISAVLKGTVTPRIQLFAKLGMHRWDVDTAIQVNNISASEGESGTDLFGGVGANFYLGRHFFARVEYERFNIDVDTNISVSNLTYESDGGGDVDLLSASLIYKF